MRKLLCFALLFLGLAPIVAFVVHAWSQSGTPHGLLVTATASGTAQSFNVYQCAGTCTPTGTWTQIATGLTAPSVLLPSAGYTPSSTYSFAMTEVNAGEESAFSNISTITVTPFPVNPPAPTGCNSKEQ